jgi:hypothetical protein
MNRPDPAIRPLHPPGFSLVETALATVLVGGLLVVSMNLLGASRMTQARYADREQALILAEDLLNEVLAEPYADADGGGIALGLELGELFALGASFDDADDYDGYHEAPPTDADGQPIPGAERFTRTVAVQWVEPDDPDAVSASETGVKRVTVTVSIAGRELAALSGLRAAAWPGPTAQVEAAP